MKKTKFDNELLEDDTKILNVLSGVQKRINEPNKIRLRNWLRKRGANLYPKEGDIIMNDTAIITKLVKPPGAKAICSVTLTPLMPGDNIGAGWGKDVTVVFK